MALADAISTPQVGSTMLKTFAAISEVNRRNQEFQLNQEKAAQGILLKEAALNIREQAHQLNVVKAANNLDLGMRRLAVAETEAERKAALAEIEIAKKKFELDSKEGDMNAAREASALLSVPDEKGITLHQRLLSDDPKVSKDAMRAFVGVADKMQGKGPLTKSVFDSVRKGFTDNHRILESQNEAELAARREARLKESADTSAALGERRETRLEDAADINKTIGERRMTETERHNKAVEANAAERTGKMGAAGAGPAAKHGEWFPGGSAKVKMVDTVMTLDQIRETLATGGATAEALKKALKTVGQGKTEDGVATPGWVDDALISEMTKQGKQILLQKKAGVASPSTPKQLEKQLPLPAQQTGTSPSEIDLIFQRPTQDQNNVVEPGATSPGIGMEDFFGLPRNVAMA